MTVTDSTLRIGIVGAGNFAAFAAGCFVSVKGVEIVAVADTISASASALAKRYNSKAYADVDSFLADPDIDLVYISTPPALHYAQSKAALLAGKHVICEKPAALKADQARTLVDLARKSDLLYVVNLMQRYNPLFQAISEIMEEDLLGDFTHGFFENYASDEFLPVDHWFWDKTQSGGIFIEHGVHFFDLFAGWLGQGELAWSARWRRPGTQAKIYDRVEAVVNYSRGPVTFYHGFDQPKVLDRQEMRLQFERGEITLYGWVPTKMVLNGLFEEEALQVLKAKFPGASFEERDPGVHAESPISSRGRFKKFRYDKLIRMQFGDESTKMTLYAELLVRMLKNQWSWIVDHSTCRVVSDDNAIRSVRIAEQATSRAKDF